ncbi:MAG: HEPN domain-containing protein [Alphaproteobacteria bacterium]|nr:HEPN domain-containing protein [Alphaproteobacteria bacterium]
MSDLEQAVELAGAAERDISALRGMGDATVFADEIFGFHVQQAAEKLFKAWLASQGEAYPLSHDLAALSDMLSTGGADVARFNGLVDYTRYAVRLRYAGADPGACPLDRPHAIGQVEALLAAVQRRLADTEEI